MGVHPYYVAHISVLLASSFIGFLLLLRVWNFRSLPGAYGLILAILCAVEWSLAYVMEIVRLDMAEKIFWGKLQYGWQFWQALDLSPHLPMIGTIKSGLTFNLPTILHSARCS